MLQTDGNWGKKNSAVASLEHKKRTPWGFKYLCLSIIDDIEIVLGVLPLWPLSDKAKVLDELLIMVKNKVKIRKIRLGELLMNRGFEYNKTLRVLEAHKISALFPVKKNQRVKRLIADFHAGKNIGLMGYEYQIKDPVPFTLFFTPVPEKKLPKNPEIHDRYHAWGATIPRIGIKDREQLAESYRGRWQIEVDFDVIKNEFLIKTNSGSGAVRLFFFLLAVFLFNIWYMLRSIIGELTVECWREYFEEDLLYHYRDLDPG